MPEVTRHRNSSPPRTKVAFTRSALRSAISNGTALLNGIDHRGPEMRRLRDLVEDITADLGGADLLSTPRQILIRRAAMLTLQCELYERQWAERWSESGGSVANNHALQNYQTCANTLRRLLQALGLERHCKDITPSLEEYAAGL